MSARRALSAALWPPSRRHEALHALARASGLALLPGKVALPSEDVADSPVSLDRYAELLGLELEQLVLTHDEARARLGALAPLLVELKGERKLGFFALIGGRGARVRALCPDGLVRSLPASSVCQLVWADVYETLVQGLEPWLARAPMGTAARSRARALLVAEALRRGHGCRATLLKTAPEAELRTWARQFGVWRKLLVLVALHAAQYTLGLGAFWVVGRAVLYDRIDIGTFSAFILLSLSAVPLHLLEGAQLSELALRLSALFKQRAFSDALASDPDALRRRGVGEHFGHVLDTDAFESLAVTGGLGGALALIEVVAAGVILAGSAGLALVLALSLWLALIGALSLRYMSKARRFAAARIELTQGLVERMLGHRTRLVQERRACWHVGEDELLEPYLRGASDQDRDAARIVAWSGRGFLVVALAMLAPLWLSERPSSAALASALAGVLLGARAFGRVALSATSLAEAKLAHERLRAVAAGPTRHAQPVPAVFEPEPPAEAMEVVLRADDLRYQAGMRPSPVFSGTSLQLAHGERWLLTGSSGSGKSTLVSVLAGLRKPDAGTVLWRGLDLASLGLRGWRRHVALAPQFHENHVLAGTLAFNLLLGQSWPPSASALAEAEAMCVELGLSDLLARMPSRLQQQVGETGWQLSHGERSRLFLARALLARAELVLLDETFAALDPVTLETCLSTAMRHAPTLVLVAHP